MWYTLDKDNNPIKASTNEYLEWIEKNPLKKVVAQDTIKEIFISTVFLGLDHAFPMNSNKPVLWETMIFRGEHDQYQERYVSHEDAVAGHEFALIMVKRSLNKKV
jgi:hypothetical protein